MRALSNALKNSDRAIVISTIIRISKNPLINSGKKYSGINGYFKNVVRSMAVRKPTLKISATEISRTKTFVKIIFTELKYILTSKYQLLSRISEKVR
jgi:hypothetical protein